MLEVMPFEEDDTAAAWCRHELGAGEVAAHHVTHGPFRVWCRACMIGRCFASKHIVSDEHEYDALAVVGNDCFHGG